MVLNIKNNTDNIFRRIDEVLNQKLNIVDFDENNINKVKKDSNIFILLHQNKNQVIILDHSSLNNYNRFKYLEYFIIDHIKSDFQLFSQQGENVLNGLTTEKDYVNFINSSLFKKRIEEYKIKMKKYKLENFNEFLLKGFEYFLTPIGFSEKFAIVYTAIIKQCFLNNNVYHTKISDDFYFKGLQELVFIYNQQNKMFNIDFSELLRKSLLCLDKQDKQVVKNKMKIFVEFLKSPEFNIDIKYIYSTFFMAAYGCYKDSIGKNLFLTNFKKELCDLSKEDKKIIISKFENPNFLHSILTGYKNISIFHFDGYNIFTKCFLETLLNKDYILNISRIFKSDFNIFKNQNIYMLENIYFYIDELVILQDDSFIDIFKLNIDIEHLFINKDSFYKTLQIMNLLNIDMKNYIKNYELTDKKFNNTILKIEDLK